MAHAASLMDRPSTRMHPPVDWAMACPRCRQEIGPLSSFTERATCGECGQDYIRRDGIWRFLPPERAAYYAPFLLDYTLVRHREGRGSDDPAYYQRLPEAGPDDPLAWQWRIRARSYDGLRRSVLPSLGAGLRILDLGAGTGWLSNRLAAQGHVPCAIDITDDDRDGLSAARHYDPTWSRVQAEFDRLPFADGQADVVIYNASLHYSADYSATLREALRVMRQDGRIVVMDSPIYRREESGQQMVAERHAAFAREYGTRSDALPNLEYLTWDRIGQLTRDLGLSCQVVRPWYGWRWAIRPLVARLRRRREPSTFAILVARR